VLGYSVELKHDEKETDMRSHGFVRLQTTNGQELSSSELVQHNQSYHQRTRILTQLAQEADEKFKDLSDGDDQQPSPASK
jgi:hypothetical protein